MTETTPVERVARALEAAGFRRMAQPLEIAGLKFDVSAAFVGVSPSPDLVVVGDSTIQTARDLRRTVEGLSRALDAVRSRRPLTLVLVGPRLESSAITALSRYARVLSVGESADEVSLNNWLAVLLPLRLPDLVEARGLDSLAELSGSDAETQALIDLAPSGAAAVAEHFIAMIEEPFAEEKSDDDENLDAEGFE